MLRELPVGTVTLLFTDIEGSTRLLRELGPDRYARALGEHRRALRDAFGAEGGVEVDTQGDAFFVAFPTAASAAAAAAAAQRALAGGPIDVRMGLHTGTPAATAEGYVGIDVHRGARIAALAHGRQVIASATTAALLDGEALVDLGRHRLKDFDGPQQLFQVGGGSFPPLRTPGALDLPSPATQFVGREHELLTAAGLWLDRSPHVLSILGPGGTGKTRFSIELARFLAEDADGGTVFVSLAPVRDAALVLSLIAARVGASAGTPEAIASRIGERRTHVVLDNLEQLLPEVARPLADILAAATGLRIIATSREPLRVSGEVEFDLAPMAEGEAVGLFLERAQAVRAEVAESPAVHELVRRLDGLPLAIELAAARVKLLRPEQLLERIGTRLDLLKGGRDADERHATLRATIAWSHDLLDAGERQLFARLAIFQGGCTIDDAEDVCDADVDTLASLLDKSLLRRRDADDGGDDRFWMLETIREFASECLAESGERDELRRRQADRLIALADRAGLRAVIEAPEPWDFDLVAPEMDNVRAVLEWAAAHDPERGLRLAALLEAFWVVRDPVEGANWIGLLLAASPDARPRLRAQALRALGGSLDIVGRSEEAAPCYRESLELSLALEDGPAAAHVRFRVAANMMMRGEAEAAWPRLEDALAEARRLGLKPPEGQALGFLAEKAYREGDLQGAVEMALESARISNEVGWTWWEAGQLHTAAEIERERGRMDDAEKLARRSADLALALGDRRQTLFAAAELAIAASARDDPTRAGTIWGAIESELDRIGVSQWEEYGGALEALVLRVDGPAFAEARRDGSLLSIAEAIESRPGV